MSPCRRYEDESGVAIPEWFASNLPCALPRSFTPKAGDNRRVCAHCGSGFHCGDGNLFRAQTLPAARAELRSLMSRMGCAPDIPDDDKLAAIQADIGALRAISKQNAWQPQRFCSMVCLHSSAACDSGRAR